MNPRSKIGQFGLVVRFGRTFQRQALRVLFVLPRLLSGLASGAGVGGLGFGVWGLGFGVWDFGVAGLGFGVSSFEC